MDDTTHTEITLRTSSGVPLYTFVSEKEFTIASQYSQGPSKFFFIEPDVHSNTRTGQKVDIRDFYFYNARHPEVNGIYGVDVNLWTQTHVDENTTGRTGFKMQFGSENEDFLNDLGTALVYTSDPENATISWTLLESKMTTLQVYLTNNGVRTVQEGAYFTQSPLSEEAIGLPAGRIAYIS